MYFISKPSGWKVSFVKPHLQDGFCKSLEYEIHVLFLFYQWLQQNAPFTTDLLYLKNLFHILHLLYVQMMGRTRQIKSFGGSSHILYQSTMQKSQIYKDLMHIGKVYIFCVYISTFSGQPELHIGIDI